MASPPYNVFGMEIEQSNNNSRRCLFPENAGDGSVGGGGGGYGGGFGYGFGGGYGFGYGYGGFGFGGFGYGGGEVWGYKDSGYGSPENLSGYPVNILQSQGNQELKLMTLEYIERFGHLRSLRWGWTPWGWVEEENEGDDDGVEGVENLPPAPHDTGNWEVPPGYRALRGTEALMYVEHSMEEYSEWRRLMREQERLAVMRLREDSARLLGTELEAKGWKEGDGGALTFDFSRSCFCEARCVCGRDQWRPYMRPAVPPKEEEPENLRIPPSLFPDKHPLWYCKTTFDVHLPPNIARSFMCRQPPPPIEEAVRTEREAKLSAAVREWTRRRCLMRAEQAADLAERVELEETRALRRGGATIASVAAHARAGVNLRMWETWMGAKAAAIRKAEEERNKREVLGRLVATDGEEE